MASLIGKKIEMLTVTKEEIVNKRTLCYCVCDCGNEKWIRKDSLSGGKTTSCGCYKNSGIASVKHGDRKKGERDRLYEIWANIKQRCCNKNNPHYHRYGGKGIELCDEWMKYDAFKQWAMSHGYNKDLTIDRKRNNGNYEPSNCRWITNQEQQYNKGTNVLLTYDGETKCLAEWAKEKGLSYSCIYKRYSSGWTTEKILTT